MSFNPQRYSNADTQHITMQLGMNTMLKSGLRQKNIIFQTCTKTPRVSVPNIFTHAFFGKWLKHLTVKRSLNSLYFLWIRNYIHFPFVSEYQIIICVIRVCCILTCINCKWKTKRICIYLICSKYEILSISLFLL